MWAACHILLFVKQLYECQILIPQCFAGRAQPATPTRGCVGLKLNKELRLAKFGAPHKHAYTCIITGQAKTLYCIAKLYFSITEKQGQNMRSTSARSM